MRVPVAGGLGVRMNSPPNPKFVYRGDQSLVGIIPSDDCPFRGGMPRIGTTFNVLG